MKAFVVMLNNSNKRDFEIGKKLVLRDEIEEMDFCRVGDDFNISFVRDLFESSKFDLEHKHELDKYRKHYLIITSERYIVKAFFRI